MRCASCDHDNRDAAKFCEECGTPVAPPPPSSRRPVGTSESGRPLAVSRDPRSYTPKHLADRILGARAALEGERKQVTVLFADIRGSMELAERFGPEGWHKVLDRFFHLVNEGVHRFEGTVNQYTGDGIMALFGAPLAHEDHAQRACHAALHMRDRLRAFGQELSKARGVELAIRMGINSGEVVVGSIGDDLRMDYTAQGHTVGLAQRVEQLAAPNSVCVAQATAALVADYFDLRDLGEFELKGVSEPVRVHQLERPRSERTRIDVVLARSGEHLVGRRDELALLEQGMEQALAGRGQVIAIAGEPGVGKTRLSLELVRECRARGALVAQAHCPAHAASVELLPIAELLRSLFDIHVGESPDKSRRKIRRSLLQLNKSFTESLPFVCDLLEVPDPQRPVKLVGDERRSYLAGLLRRVVQAQSAATPLVLFIDDVHCADAASGALLGEIVEALEWTRTLLLVNFRPGYKAAWLSGPYHRELVLGALSEDAADELLLRLVGDHPSTRDLRRLVRERTAGNPFFVEEVVQSLIERAALVRPPTEDGATALPLQLVQPVEDLIIPPTIQALLASRLDRLPQRDKTVLQAAAVIGRSFSPAVLRHLLAHEPPAGAVEGDAVDAALMALHEAEFLRGQDGNRDAELAFKHPLTQAVAYGSQLAEVRTRLHLGTARAIEDIHKNELGQYAALLAHHFAAAEWKHEANRWRRRAALRVTNIEVGRARSTRTTNRR